MKILVFPGSYNPIHNGHLGLLKAAMEELLPNLALLVPMHPSSAAKELQADIVARKSMIVAGINEGLPPELASMADLDWYEPKSPRAMIDLYHHYQRNYPGSELIVLLGEEGVKESFKWVGIEELVKGITVAMPFGIDPLLLSKMRRRGFRVQPVRYRTSPITSQKVRTLLAEQKPTLRVLPKAVRVVAQERGLYGLKKPTWVIK